MGVPIVREGMVRSPSRWSRGIALLMVGVLVLAALPGVVAAETRSGGTVVVNAGETVDDDLDAFGGTVIIRGTVDGDLEAFAGNVFIEGEVTGDVETASGNVRISGDVGGSVEATAGNVVVEDGATIGGNLQAAGGNIVLAGSIGGNAEIAGGSITLADSASIGGDVRYAIGEDGEFNNRGADIGGSTIREDDIDIGPIQAPQIPDWTFGVYGFLVNLVLGAVLLLVMPNVSRRIAEQATTQPVRSAGIGLLTLVGIPVLLVITLITIIGIPLAFIGGMLFILLIWIALVYGRFAIGVWLLSYVDEDSRWLALLVGMVSIAIVNAIPVEWIGNLIEFGVLLVGLGAIAAVAYQRYQRRRKPEEPSEAEPASA